MRRNRSRSNRKMGAKSSGRQCGWRKLALWAPISVTISITLAISASSQLARAILLQPHNYLLDDSALTSQHDNSASLSPFYNDAHGGPEQQADRDIVSIIGDSLARLRLARMLDQQQQQQQQQNEQAHESAAAAGQLSQEMAELIRGEQAAKQEAGEQQSSLSSSVASLLLNAAQAAIGDEQSAAAAAAAESSGGQSERPAQMTSRGQIMELDTSQTQASSAASLPSKSDLKSSGPIQWYNPKETIPVLKISSMATPSKYKKVYFRSEKKLVDGAFHSPSASETPDKKTSGLVKSLGQPTGASVQRRSSRGSASSAPPSVLQDGVIDFLKKFRDVYVQTRPAGSSSAVSSAGSSPMNFASSVMSAAASSPLASFLAPGTPGARPNLMGALSTASQMVNSAALLTQAASSSSGPSVAALAGSAPSTSSAATGAAAAAANANKAPLTAQSYVSFWSKTFPTWVRKMLKQMRRRSLYNSSKRQQHQHQQQHHHHATAGIGQKAAGSSAVSSMIESANTEGGAAAAATGSGSASS